MSLPPAVRKDVALKLLESVEPDEAFGRGSEEWLHTEAASAYDALKANPGGLGRDCARLFRDQVGRPFMTGRINYTPEAEQQLNELDDWITKAASAEFAQQFGSAILDHIDAILVFPRGKCVAGGSSATVRDQRSSTCFRRSDPQCQR